MSRLVAASWLLALLLCGITSTTTASSAPAASSTDGTAAAAVSHYAMNGFDELAKGAVVPEDHFVCGPADKCYCSAWLHSHGSKEEKTAFTVMQWIVFAVCIISLLFYAYQTWRATCGWEEVYVTIIELVHVCFGLWHEVDSPCTLYLSTGNMVLWLRYAEWLLTCPVILIHLSNLTGMKNDYNKRTMALLVSDVGCIVWGTTAALSTDFVKIIFFFLGLLYGFYTFYAAAKIYIEAYHTVPKGICRQLVRLQAYDFFFTWSMFPILFMVGPEGFGKITAYSSGIAHEVCDLLSKNLWGLMGHFIRVKIHEHILVHGNITKKTKVNVAGDMVELDTYVDQDEEHDEGTIDRGTQELANRHSFVVMRENMRAKGVDVRASLGDIDGTEMTKAGNMNGTLEPGRIILCVPDMSLVDFFREQFSQMPVPFEVVPALGPEVALQLVQQALSIGGANYIDYVMVHPEFLRDRSPGGLIGRLKMSGMRVCAFGWVPSGAPRELIEACGPMLDGFVEGPSFLSGFNLQQLVQLTQRMQTMKKQKAGFGMMGGGGMGMMNGAGAGMMSMGGAGGGGMMNGGGGMNMGGMNGGGGMSMGGAPGGGMGGAGGMSMGGAGGMMNGGGSMMHNGGMMGSMTGSMGHAASFHGSASMPTANPLYGTAASPLGSGMGATPAPAAAAPAANETEMLTQLMGEINRLKAELGEH